jgi:hypothetical protein
VNVSRPDTHAFVRFTLSLVGSRDLLHDGITAVGLDRLQDKVDFPLRHQSNSYKRSEAAVGAKLLVQATGKQVGEGSRVELVNQVSDSFRQLEGY